MLPALRRAGYTWTEQTRVGCTAERSKHNVDVIATKDGVSVLVSMKWQETSGTAEQKVPFEVMCLTQPKTTGTRRRAGETGSSWREPVAARRLGQVCAGCFLAARCDCYGTLSAEYSHSTGL